MAHFIASVLVPQETSEPEVQSPRAAAAAARETPKEPHHPLPAKTLYVHAYSSPALLGPLCWWSLLEADHIRHPATAEEVLKMHSETRVRARED